MSTFESRTVCMIVIYFIGHVEEIDKGLHLERRDKSMNLYFKGIIGEVFL